MTVSLRAEFRALADMGADIQEISQHEIERSTENRPGTVVSVGGGHARALGELVGAATCRTHHAIDVWDEMASRRIASDEPVLVIGLPENLDGLSQWPGFASANYGVVAARTEPGLVDFALRAVFGQPTGTRARGTIGFPTVGNLNSLDAVSIDEVRTLALVRSRELVVNSHGIECSVMLPDGVICGQLAGRLDTRGARRIPPCAFGRGCFRRDIDDDDRFRGASLNADLVVLSSCHMLAVGVSSYPHDVSVSLSVAEGSSLAVIGSIGTHIGDLSAISGLLDKLRCGARLGEVIAAQNRAWSVAGSFNRLGLYGDPARSVVA